MQEMRREYSKKGEHQDPFDGLDIHRITSLEDRIRVTARRPGWTSSYKFIVSSNEVIGQTSLGAWETLSNRNSQIIRSKLKSFLINHKTILQS